MFFQSDRLKNAISNFLTNTENLKSSSNSYASRIRISRKVVTWILNNPEEWDKNCAFNIVRLGNQFPDALNSYSLTNDSNADLIYVYVYAFLAEFEFNKAPSNGEEINELTYTIALIQNDSEPLDERLKSLKTYVSYHMPASILKKYINNKDLKKFSEFNSLLEKAKQLSLDWNSEIQEKKLSVDVLKKNLDEYKTAFSFVGLNKGFEELANKKYIELRYTFIFLIFMGVLILSPLVYQFFEVSNLASERGFLFNFASLLPLISIELVLIYFFRIILINHRSIKTQILQLELRQTLCKFIQSYVDYSKKIKVDDASALEKFENLIFSAVLSDSDKIPSTFDGVEQISNFIKSIKGQ